MTSEIKRVAVVGAGTMGAGIAQACLQAGLPVQLLDVNPAQREAARQSIESSLHKMTARKILTSEQAIAALNLLELVDDISRLRADLVIEAIVEKLDRKQVLFQDLQRVLPEAILASNTSTFPIQKIAAVQMNPARCVGLHFFNPPVLMKLVEVISSAETSPDVTSAATNFCSSLGKTPVQVKDSPGFIVNRVARPFYLEALRQLENGTASHEGIDKLMRSAGFKMGPFELMDLIGMDVNLAVTTSLYEALGSPTRFTPSSIQLKKVKDGELGRKTGRGFYAYP